jgi:hypothetical protein
MPCDTRIKTSVPDLAKVDRKRLEAVLGGMGWVVRHEGAALLAQGPDYSRLHVEGGTATLTTYGGRPAEDMLAEVRRAYAARTVADVSARFGFKVQGREQLLGGAQRLMLRR